MNKLETQYSSFENLSLKKKSLQCSKIVIEGNVRKVPPDGGWGWMVVLGSFIGTILSTFQLAAFSILYSPILMTHSVSSTKISWIFNAHTLVSSVTMLFTGPLCDEYGWRKVAIFGGVSNSVSVLLSAFAPNPEFLFFSFSLLGGIGISTGMIIARLIISRYFVKHRGLALGISSIGGCISGFLSPIIANYLLEHFGYIGASLIFGAIVLNQCVGGALFQPVEWHMKHEETKISPKDEIHEKLLTSRITSDPDKIQEKYLEQTQCTGAVSSHSTNSNSHSTINITTSPTPLEDKDDEDTPKNIKPEHKFWSILKSTYDNLKSLRFMRVQIIAWGYFGLLLGYFNFRMWVPFVITNAGYSLEAAAWCSSLSSIGNVVGRIVASVLADRKFFNVRYGFMSGLFLIGLSIIAFSLVNDITFYIILICGWGLGVGSSIALDTPAMISVMGVEMLPTIYGVAGLLQGVGGISFGILAGVIKDATSSYTYTLWLLGGCEFVAFSLWIFMPCAERFDEKMYPKEKDKRKKQKSQNY